MTKRMLIDANHPEETRVVVLDGSKGEGFDFEAASKRPLKGNIYLAKVTRVEPSLQAAFVEYGGNRQGFLAFSEIHPDYYQIPVADRMAILAAQTERMMAEEDFDALDTASPSSSESSLASEEQGAPAEEGRSEHETDETSDMAEDEHEGSVVADNDLVSEPEIESGDVTEVKAGEVTGDLSVAGETFLSEGSGDSIEAAAESEPSTFDESRVPEEPAPIVRT